MAELLELKGSVEHVVYHNENNQYTVMEVETEIEMVTVVGTFPYINKGEVVKVFGYWTQHQSFGTQFKAESFEREKPENTIAILRYLSSGAIKGVGQATAKRIVQAFGSESLEIIEQDPERLVQIKGITKEKALAISAELKNIYGIRELMVYLSKFNIKPAQSILVWKKFGGASVDLINENPYIICSEGIELEFAIADEIAQSMEKLHDNRGRIRAGIIYVLRHNANNGHSCIPIDKLCVTTTRMLGVELEQVKENIISMCESVDLICEEIFGQDFIFLPKYFNSEMYISDRIKMLLKYPPRSIVGIESEIESIEIKNNVEYAELQKEAIIAALDKGFLILTGGPGTGKTTTLNAIIQILEIKGEEVFLAAPTGRAAKRMSELTGREAKTIHRMLQVDWDEQDRPIFIKNEKSPLDCDAVIVDELSMVDINVMEGLLAALPLGCRLILVGDTDQLPSVGAGSVLSDLILSNKITTVKLEEIFRQARESLIVMNSHSIVNGEMPVLNRVDSDCFFMDYYDETRLINTIVDLIHTRLPNRYDYQPTEDIQILCPGRKGSVGTENINKIVREMINPADKEKKQAEIMGTLFREGDKVMHIKNNYNLPWSKEDGTTGQGVFNGDIGIITEIDKAAGVVRVKIDDKEAVYDFEQAGKELEHAYAITVHKSQGNEFPAVIMPVFKGTDKLKYRNLLYTGMTRAKEILILIGQKSVIAEMINNDRKTLRYTGLLGMLTNEETDET